MKSVNDTVEKADSAKPETPTAQRTATSQGVEATANVPSHTPGPWKYIGAIQGREPEQHEIRLAEGYGYMPNGRPGVIVKGDKAAANARLIAAAPELLEVSRMLLHIVHSQVACVDSKFHAGLDKAEAAIAKAEGTEGK